MTDNYDGPAMAQQIIRLQELNARYRGALENIRDQCSCDTPEVCYDVAKAALAQSSRQDDCPTREELDLLTVEEIRKRMRSSKVPTWQCSNCKQTIQATKARLGCAGRGCDNDGKCSALPCPHCGKRHYWTGSIAVSGEEGKA